MSMVLELPPRLEAILHEQARLEGRPAERLIIELLERTYLVEDSEVAAAVEGIRRGVAAAERGDEMPFEEFVRLRELERRTAEADSRQ